MGAVVLAVATVAHAEPAPGTYQAADAGKGTVVPFAPQVPPCGVLLGAGSVKSQEVLLRATLNGAQLRLTKNDFVLVQGEGFGNVPTEHVVRTKFYVMGWIHAGGPAEFVAIRGTGEPGTLIIVGYVDHDAHGNPTCGSAIIAPATRTALGRQ